MTSARRLRTEAPAAVPRSPCPPAPPCQWAVSRSTCSPPTSRPLHETPPFFCPRPFPIYRSPFLLLRCERFQLHAPLYLCTLSSRTSTALACLVENRRDARLFKEGERDAVVGGWRVRAFCSVSLSLSDRE